MAIQAKVPINFRLLLSAKGTIIAHVTNAVCDMISTVFDIVVILC